MLTKNKFIQKAASISESSGGLFVAAFGLVSISVLVILSSIATWTINSDDIAEQVMAHNLLTPGAHSLRVQIDTYFLKYPLYYLFNALTHPSVRQVIIESVLLNLIMITLLLVWWLRFNFVDT